MDINRLLAHQVEYRIIDCGIHRIISCLHRLSEDDIHYRPNASSNSIDNQVRHLDGNVRQWLIATMSSSIDRRRRKQEFDQEIRSSKSELITQMRTLETDIRAVLPNIINIDPLQSQDVQCYTESNLSILIHVIEHFSYHVGQITYITKMLLDVDTGYYAEDELG